MSSQRVISEATFYKPRVIPTPNTLCVCVVLIADTGNSFAATGAAPALQDTVHHQPFFASFPPDSAGGHREGLPEASGAGRVAEPPPGRARWGGRGGGCPRKGRWSGGGRGGCGEGEGEREGERGEGRRRWDEPSRAGPGLAWPGRRSGAPAARPARPRCRPRGCPGRAPCGVSRSAGAVLAARGL